MKTTLGSAMETGAEAVFLRLREFARHPTVVGVVVTGSRGKGFGTPESDVDACVVFEDTATDADLASVGVLDCDRLDVTALRETAFAHLAAQGESDAWDRYDFAHVRPLADRNDRLLSIVREKGSPPSGVAQELAATALDAFLNAAWRSQKAKAREEGLAVRLESVAAVQPLVTFLFAAEGRLAPWPDYLERELTAFPLEQSPLGSEALAAALVALADGISEERASLVRTIVAYARAAGFASVVDSWPKSQLAQMMKDASGAPGNGEHSA